MNLLKCPKCGELFSDSYKECPFCQEDEAYLTGNKRGRGRGRRVEKPKSPSILGPALVVVVVLLAVFLVYTFLGDKIVALFDGTEKPPVEEPVDPDPVPSLRLDQTSLTLTVGDTAVLTASGAEDCQWSSSDSAVASVDENGKVSAVAAGTATVTVSAEGGSAACVVTVEKKEEPKKELRLMYVGGEVYKSSAGYGFTIDAGDTLELYIDGTDAAVTWKVEHPSVATISADGVFKAVSAGQTTLKATVDGQTITCSVIVD